MFRDGPKYANDKNNKTKTKECNKILSTEKNQRIKQ